MKNINEETLQELGIFEIRNIAREIGVHSPTIMKKQELIEKVMRVINGEEEPYVRTTKQGRPPKNISALNDLVDVIVPSKILDEKREDRLKTFFNDFNESLNVKDYDSNETYFKALIKVYDEYALAFLKDIVEDVKNVVFINKSQLNFYNLRTGDEIAGKYIETKENNPNILKEIYSINSIVFTNDFKRREDFGSLFANFPDRKLKTNLYKIDEQVYADIDLFSPIAFGQRVLLCSEDGDNQLNYKILHKLTTGTNNLTGLVILIDDMPENYYELRQNVKLDVLSNNFGKQEDLMLEIEVKIQSLLKRAENGEDVLLFINDMQKFYNFLLEQFVLKKYSLEESKIKVSNLIKKAILLGKYVKNFSSLTVLVGFDEEFCKDYKMLFNNQIFYTKNGYEFELDKHKSTTINIEKILTKTELEKLKITK